MCIRDSDEYVRRLRPVMALDTQWHKTDEELETAVRKDTGVVVSNTCDVPVVGIFPVMLSKTIDICASE